MQQCSKSGSVVQCFGAVFDEHTARIKRIVKEEVSGCSAIIDQDAWPMIRFRIQDAQGTILSRAYRSTCAKRAKSSHHAVGSIAVVRGHLFGF
jgi:hypothetical protein